MNVSCGYVVVGICCCCGMELSGRRLNIRGLRIFDALYARADSGITRSITCGVIEVIIRNKNTLIFIFKVCSNEVPKSDFIMSLFL